MILYHSEILVPMQFQIIFLRYIKETMETSKCLKSKVETINTEVQKNHKLLFLNTVPKYIYFGTVYFLFSKLFIFLNCVI